MEVDVPVSVAYDCYLDREAIPKWMPFISTVKVHSSSFLFSIDVLLTYRFSGVGILVINY